MTKAIWPLILISSLVWPGLTAEEPASVGLARIPVFFEANVGQAPRGVEFVGHASSVQVQFLPSGYRLIAPGDVLEVEFVGGSASRVRAVGPTRGHSSYFIGARERWRRDIPHYKRVVYEDVYPGIDLVFYGEGGHLEYDVVVAPGADPGVINLQTREPLSIRNGMLMAASSKFVHRAPAVTSGHGSARWTVERENAGLWVDGWDGESELVIDPVVDYASYLPITQNLGLAVGNDGSIVVGGTAANGFAATAGSAFENPPEPPGTFVDAVVMKLSPSGDAIEFATYLGGNGTDTATAATVATNGEIFVAGTTGSDDFPMGNGYQGGSDWFIARLSPQGDELLMAEVSGGSGNESVSDVVLTGNGVYLAGGTQSADMQSFAYDDTLNGTSDGFIAGYSVNGSLLFRTYLGGDGVDTANSIVEGLNGELIVVGLASDGFPTTSGTFLEQDANASGFVAALSFTGDELLRSTLFPTRVAHVAVDGGGSLWICAEASSDLQVTPGAIKDQFSGTSDAYIAEISESLASLSYGTYVGGSERDECGEIFSVGDEVAIVGLTQSDDVLLTEPLPADPYPESSYVVWIHPAYGIVRKGAVYGNGYSFVYAADLDPAGNPVIGGLAFTGIDTTDDALFPTGEDVTSYLLKVPRPAPLPNLSLSLAQTQAEIGDVVQVELEFDPTWGRDADIALSSSDPEAFLVPPTVTMAAGEASATVDVIATGPGSIEVTASVQPDLGSQTATASLQISDGNTAAEPNGCQCRTAGDFRGDPGGRAAWWLTSAMLVALLVVRRRRY